MQGLPFPMHCASTPLTMRFCAACSGSYKAICTHTHTSTRTHTHAHKRTHNDAQTRAHVSTFTSLKMLKLKAKSIHWQTILPWLARGRTFSLHTCTHTQAHVRTIEKHVSMSSRFNKPPNAHPHLWHSSTRRLTLRCHNVGQVWTNTSMNLALNYATSCTHRHTHTQAHTLQHTRAICAYTQTWKKLELDQWNKERFQQKHVDHKFLTSREKPTILVLHTQPRMCMNIHTQIHT